MCDKTTRRLQSRASQLLFASSRPPSVVPGPRPRNPRRRRCIPRRSRIPGVYSGRLKVDYPTPYELATEDAIRKTLERVHAYVDQAAPVQVIDDETGAPVTDLKRLPAKVALARTDMQILTYEWGVTYAGMLRSAQATGDKRYTRLRRTSASPRSRRWPRTRRRICRRAPRTLTTRCRRTGWGSGPSCCRAGWMIPAPCAPRSSRRSSRASATRSCGRGSTTTWNTCPPNSSACKDGTLARNRPLPNSLWLDDLYMSVPCLAQAGKLTGERRYYDDAAKQILQFADRMFVKDKGLFMHAWVQDMKHHPAFHWARANGWAIMAMVELLEVLPEDHPDAAAHPGVVPRACGGSHRQPGPRGPLAPVARPARILRRDFRQRDVRVRHRARHQSRLARWAGVRAGGRRSAGTPWSRR